MTPLDVVYVFGPAGNEDTDELRHSLRSLVNMPHGRVWVAGHRPRVLADSVGHIPSLGGRAGWGERFADSTANLLAACLEPQVSDNFVLMNDDFFLLAPIARPPMLHRGPLAVEAERARARKDTEWAALHFRTLDVLRYAGISSPLSYEMHAPMVVNKHLMRGVLESTAHHGPLCKRSLYGNLAHCGGELAEDVKLSRMKDTPPGDGALFVSTSETSWRFGPVGEWLRRRFPAPCRYEMSRGPVPVGGRGIV